VNIVGAPWVPGLDGRRHQGYVAWPSGHIRAAAREGFNPAVSSNS
jgi:hypothetical protein